MRLFPDAEVDPEWLTHLTLQADQTIHSCERTPLILAGRHGRLDRREFERFCLTVGTGLIRNFPVWLERIYRKLPDHDRPLRTFVRANQRREREHWRFWLEMSQVDALIAPHAFDDFDLPLPMSILRDNLDRLVEDEGWVIPFGILILLVERAAMHLTTLVASEQRHHLRGKLWMELHQADSEVVRDHFADSRAILARYGTSSHVALRSKMGLIGVLFESSLAEAYRAQAVS